MQYYLSSLLGFLIVEMLANWGGRVRLSAGFNQLTTTAQHTTVSSTRTARAPRLQYSLSSVGAEHCRYPNSISQRTVAILDAGRNALSFFLLLVVALGLSVVRESLGRTMLRCQLLAVAHFIFGGTSAR